MSFIVWNNDYALGIPVIDEQHKKIVDYINELDEVKDDDDLQKTNEVLTALIEYTVTHFSFEEKLQEKAAYANIDEHKRHHVVFVERMNDFKERAEEGEDVAKVVLSMLKLWLLAHIKREDVGYVSVVKPIA